MRSAAYPLDCGKPDPQIADMEGDAMDPDWTNETAAAALRSRGDMTATEFRACLFLLDWTQRGVAALLQVDEGTVRQWGREKRPIPGPVATWLRRLASAHGKNPPPLAPVLRRGPGAGDRGPGGPAGGAAPAAA